MPEPIRVHFGCGDSIGASWKNFDVSPMLMIERIPLIGSLLHKALGGGTPFPREVIYGNIAEKLLVPEGTAHAAYASHVLEHLTLEEARRAVRHTFRMLRPGGMFRVIVPNLRSRAERYLQDLEAGDPEAASNFMRYSLLGLEQRPRGMIRTLRRAFSGTPHLWMWDTVAMRAELERAGFVNVRECKFGDAEDPAFRELEREDRFIDASLQRPECAMEGRKPPVGR
jgi:hypothetical protein